MITSYVVLSILCVSLLFLLLYTLAKKYSADEELKEANEKLLQQKISDLREELGNSKSLRQVTRIISDNQFFIETCRSYTNKYSIYLSIYSAIHFHLEKEFSGLENKIQSLDNRLGILEGAHIKSGVDDEDYMMEP